MYTNIVSIRLFSNIKILVLEKDNVNKLYIEFVMSAHIHYHNTIPSEFGDNRLTIEP